MKQLLKKLSFAIVTICTITSAPFAATQPQPTQPQPTEKTVLWKISGNGLDKPSYLFGTFHMLCKDDFIISEKAKKAFAGTSQLVIEANIFDPAELQVAQKEIMSDVPQSQRLSKEKYALVDSVLRAKTGVPFQRFDSIRLSALVAVLVRLGFTCPQPVSQEAALYQYAQQKQMKFTTLETMKEQVDYMNKGFSDAFFFKFLQTIDSLKQLTTRMVKAYKAEDIDVIMQEMNDADMSYWMLTRRNADWAVKMPAMMQANSCFFAVGSGHLAGENGIIQLLKAKGYTVTPVLN
ncbi:TraB/GumN family protein [Chitinophaga sp. G-6-1-13]|uniref:TraB/GumN family protein n=1 Tax=Chitinophaga fulva TaxID=2728842 RepID=A0A848GV09_9BACT|nr:TraB/GumN family protein [Chitinophaga fulva]NML41301.1 TraB/GumN family protein [Chitinophaga fulva]